MPYVVTIGEVHDGRRVYRVGDVLPEGVGDAAMEAVGVVEWREPEKPAPAPEKPAAPKRKPASQQRAKGKS